LWQSRGRSIAPFRYRDKGNLATIGRARAVADLRAIRISGFLAWAAWLVVHLWYLIGFQNRLLVLIWWSFSFPHPWPEGTADQRAASNRGRRATARGIAASSPAGRAGQSCRQRSDSSRFAAFAQ
jgi:hypothetical protein